MAYKKGIVYPCDWNGCSVKATYEVFNRKNASVGRFCGGHANFTVRDLDKLENQDVKEETKSNHLRSHH